MAMLKAKLAQAKLSLVSATASVVNIHRFMWTGCLLNRRGLFRCVTIRTTSPPPTPRALFDKEEVQSSGVLAFFS